METKQASVLSRIFLRDGSVRKELFAILLLMLIPGFIGFYSLFNAPKQVRADTPQLCNNAAFIIPSQGELGWPYLYPGGGETGYSYYHTGIDILGNIGDNVYAVHDGQVTQVTSDSVTIWHPDLNVWTYYTHLSQVLVSPGPVTQGYVIGKKGNVGTSTVHLHFSVKINSGDERYLQNTTDPSPFLGANVNYNNGATAFDHTVYDACYKVVLYDNKNYDNSGGTLSINNPGFYDLTSSFNDRASSIYLPPSWSAIVYRNANGGGGHKTLYGSDPDFSKDYFVENSSISIDNQVSAIRVINNYCPAPLKPQLKGKSTLASCGPPPPPCPNTAGFITDVTYPDGTAVTPGQSFNKTWRLQNTSSNCTWSGFTLNFISGAQMNGPASVPVPTTGPGQTVDITAPLVAPTSGGTYRGNWQLEDSQGVYVSQGGGGTVWVEISVPYSSGGGGGGNNNGGTNSITASYPSVVSPGQHFQPKVTVTIASGQLLQSRGDMLRNVDGNLYGAWPFVAVVGTVNPGTPYTFTFYANNPIVAPSSEGTYSSVWQLWQNGAWYGSSVTMTFTVKNGGGTAPGAPTLTSPSNWDYERGGATPTLCASSSDSNVQYDFQIFQGQSTPDSGWISANCWPPPTLGPYTFTWHAKVRDNSSGLESGWSDAWNFSIASQQLTMDPLTFNPSSPSAADGSIAVRSCVQGFGNVNLGLSYQINSATDGSANGDWHGFANGGNNCPDPNNPSTWGQLTSRDYADGDHLIEAIGTGPQGQTMIVSAVYHLNHRRPQDTQLISPVNNVRVNSDTVTFVWRPSVNAYSYQLVISANADMSSPLFNQNVGSVTSYQYIFSQDYSPLYWQVTSINDLGQTTSDITPFGIDRVAPTAVVNVLPATTADSTFTVTWGGSDNDAGVEWYNVQYRDGNDPSATWVNWQTNTTAIAALFTGEPGHIYYFRAQAMDKATNLSAYAGGDGDTNTLIDLNARPPTAWWDTNYTGKRDLIILNNDAQSLPSGYSIHLHFDASTTPTASDIYSTSMSANPGDDIRIVYQDATELPRFLQAFTPTQVDIWFDLQASIGPNPATDTTSYQMYFGNANAVNPPGDINAVLPPNLDSNTMGLWHFQDGSGTSVTDSSGRGHTGTINNGSWNQTGKFGPSVVFNGSSTTVNLGDSSDFNFSSFTLEGWFKFYSPGTQDLIRRDNSNRNGDAYNLGTRDGKIEYGINGRSPLRSHTQFQPNIWYHIVATYDGTTMAIYINGVLDASQTDTGGTPSSVGPLMLGNNRANSDWFKGEMQGIRVENVALSSFPYGAFANNQAEPSTNAGSPIAQPQPETPSLDVQSVNVIPGSNNTNTIVVVVQNQGNAPTNDGFSTDLYLNHQPTGPGDYTNSVNSWVASPIDSNQNITLATTVSAPNSLRVSNSGIPTEVTQTFYVQADSSGVLAKYDQSDETITGPITVCTASVDAFENDNSSATAKPIKTNGAIQVHNFNVLGDQDWVSFKAQKGVTYTINTSNQGPNARSILSLYSSDGVTLLATDYNYTSGSSQITWTALANATYYVQVKNWNPNVGGCGTDYNLRVTQGASITASPLIAAYNQIVKLSGKGFTANEQVNISLEGTPGVPLVTSIASSTGTISASFVLPETALGTYTLLAQGQTSQKVAITSIQIKSKVVLSKKSGAPNSSITLTGYGFLATTQETSEIINVYWGSSTGILLGSSPTNGVGTSGKIKFTVPTVPAGTYTLYVVGQASGVTVTVQFTVTS